MQESSYTSSSDRRKAVRKNNILCIIKILAVIIIVVPVFGYFGSLYKSAADKNVINAFTKQRFDDFYALEENSLDMVFLGSSHSYCTFDPEIIDNGLNLNSFQMGTPLQHPDTSYYELKEILKTQHPEYVVMEVYWDVLDDKFDLQQANSFFEVLKSEDIKNEYIKNVFPLSDKVKYYLLPIRYQQSYFAYEGSQMEKEIENKYGVTKKQGEVQQGEEYYRSKGYVYSNQLMISTEYDTTNQFRNFDGKDFEINSTQRKYIEKIVKLCKDENIQLIFVTAPVANVSMDYIKNYDLVHNAVEAMAAENGVPYIDYNVENEKKDMLTNENFRDDAHLNHSGVEIVDSHFIQWFKENIML